jgi:hypothetical protein
MATAVAPPDSSMKPLPWYMGDMDRSVAPVQVPVTVSDAPAATPVATINDVPKPAIEIISGLSSADPKQKLAAVQQIQKTDSETADYHPNLQPQWGAMLASALQHNWSDVHKYYNGGAVREEEARDVNNNRYYKQFNQMGATGVYKDEKGRVLNPTQLKELDSRGGVFSDSDFKVLQTAPWVNGKTNQILANNALTAPVLTATNDAYNAANLAGSSNKNADEQINILQSNPGVRNILDHISQTTPEKRQRILGLVNQYKTIGANKGATSENRGNATGTTSNTTGNATNIGGGGSVAPPAGAAGAEGAVVPGASIKGGLNTSASGTVQGTVTAGQANAATTANTNTTQEQQNVRTLIERELQGVIKNPQDFDNYMRIQALDAQNKAAAAAVPVHIMPPGFTNVTESDLQLGGTNAVIANRVEQLKNNALMAAWSNELFKATREAAKTGNRPDMNEIANQFQNSDLFKAISNTYAHKMSLELGQPSPLKSGDLVVDPKTNKIFKK